MNHPAPTHLPSVRTQRRRLICIVDPNTVDYAEWSNASATGNCELRIVACAEEALRIARTHAVDLWVVNTSLPGLSGCELCSMLRTRGTKTPVYLVADDYSPKIEQAAWQVGATLFGVKEGCEAWMQEWLSSGVNAIKTSFHERSTRRELAQLSSTH